MATWPATLPANLLLNSFAESPPDNTIRQPMDVGPAKLRPRSSAAVRPISARLFLTSTQVGILDTFYVTTLDYGSTEFDWTHPRSTAAVEMRFTNPPVYTPADKELWDVDLNMEILP